MTDAPRFRIEQVFGGWVVMGPDGLPASGLYTCQSLAVMRFERLQKAADRRAQVRQRPCMCCGKIFASEGIHNRLCDGCRRRDSAMADEVRPALPRAGGRA